MTTEFPPPDKPHAGYLLKLQLENIRCFAAKQTLDLCAPGTTDRPSRWTIILGENGTGKTTLLQALFMISPNKHEGESIRLSGFTPNFMKYSLSELWSSSDGVRYGFEVAEIEMKIYKAPSTELTVHLMRGSRGFYQILEDINKPIVMAYGSNRRITTMQKYQATKGHETLFLDEYGLRSPADWFSAALGATFGQGVEVYQRVEARYTRLLEQLPALLPDVQSVRVSNKSGTLELLFKTDYGEVTIEQLSAGYRAMAAWVVDLAAHMFNAYPDSDDPLAEPAVVLVDEFDLHLHPRWQREAIGFLTERFPAVQFIVTAHSPLVVQSAPDANIVVLKKVGDHVEIENNPVSVKTWRVDQILSSELFGEISPRAEAVEALLKERRELLGKRTLTDEDKARLKELEALVAEVPHVESAAEIKTMQLMAEITEKLKGGA